ncbi:MAG: D-alanyl-D-alanine carboxypeptidase [Pseudomonadota bacterium]|jgi:D-alanyl-D-alanine carboxypeptidase (penicillin-binding protein 5/6)
MVGLWSKNLFMGMGFLGLLAIPHEAALAQITSPAAQAVLMDYQTGEVLFCKECDVEVPPSSMTKMMTVELVFQRLKDGRLSLTDTFPVSERAWRQGLTTNESKMFVELGSQISVDDLLKGIIVSSGGDACVVVSEALGGSEEGFADMMNTRAAEIGLTRSHFVNSHGVAEPGHHMSVRDLAILSAHLIRDYPEHYHYFAIPEFTWSNITQGNRNQLLFRNVGVDGLKTGHTEAGGYGISASAEREGRRLIAVVNGLDSETARNAEAGRLLDIGFREFRNYELLAAGDPVGEVEVFGGAVDTVPVALVNPLHTIMSPDARRAMTVTLSYDGPVEAPISAGQEIGMLTVSAPGKPDTVVPVVATQAVEAGGFFKNMFLGLNALIAQTGS